MIGTEIEMPSIPTNKFYPLLYVGVPTEIMIKILEETEGDPILKKEFLEMINPTISKEKENQRLKERPKIRSETTSERPTTPVTDLDGYKDLNERISIFKKRLVILLKPEYRNK